ncbi:hypothetical protein NQZ68_033838 [Dissostichus eleginoides]|nr:hypothetical protein NQZ68_033838 [Dissostichus eleginoides]
MNVIMKDQIIVDLKKENTTKPEMFRGRRREPTQADVTNYVLAGEDRCPEIVCASTVPSPACCDITCLPPHNHDESLRGSPPTAHTANQ